MNTPIPAAINRIPTAPTRIATAATRIATAPTWSATSLLAVAAGCLALTCLALLPAVPPASAAAGVTGVTVYQHESESAYEEQLASGQIRKATINKRLRSLHLTLRDGRHVLVKYPPKQEPRVLGQLKAKHVKLSILGKSAAVAEVKAKPTHHKLRYIAGGALLVVIAVVGTILYFRRRRRRERESPYDEPALAGAARAGAEPGASAQDAQQ